jgi:hypothetical protein
LRCDDDIGFALALAVLETVNKGITVSVWLRDAYVEDYNNWVFDAGFGGASAPYRMQVLIDGNTEQIMWRAGNDSCDVVVCNWDDIPTRSRCWYPGDWHWFIFLKDETEGRMSIYVDCAIVASAGDVNSTLINLRSAPFTVGGLTWHSADLVGSMDDFRIYDYALSEGDIGLSRNAKTFKLPLS